MNAEMVIKKAQEYGFNDLASEIFTVCESALFGDAPAADAADKFYELEQEVADLAEQIDEQNQTPPTEEELAGRNPFFCKSCE